MPDALVVDAHNTLFHFPNGNSFHEVLAKQLEVSPAEIADAENDPTIKQRGETGEWTANKRIWGIANHLGRPISASLVNLMATVELHCLVQSAVDYPAARETLKAISRYIPVIICSNAHPNGRSLILTRFSWLYAIFSCDGDVRCRKPNPGIYRAVRRTYGFKPEACWYAGDGGDDELRGAKACGFRTIWVQHPDNRADPNIRFDDSVNQVSELVQLLGC